MANEKMMILKMLEEGKITSAEAARLLESADGGTAQSGGTQNTATGTPPPRAYNEGAATSRDPRAAFSRDQEVYRGNEQGARTAPGGSANRGFEDMTGDLSRKFEAFAKDLEPKLQKFTETVAEKIVSGADRISKSFAADAPAPGRSAGTVRTGSYTPSPAPSAGASGFEKNIELPVSAGYNELNLSGLNGDVRVKGYNGDKITARISYKPKRSGATIDLMKLGGKYYLNYEEDDFDRVIIDAYVPERLFHVVNISGINGNLDVSSLAAREMQFANANGQTRLAGLAAENIKADCSTGRLTLTGLTADNAIFENFNGMVEAGELDIAKLSLTNYNGGLTLLMSNFAKYDEYLWGIETSNAKLILNLPTLPDLGYHIKAHTTLGEIRLGLTGMQFIINDPALVEARSVHYERMVKKVKLTAETSNAPLSIN